MCDGHGSYWDRKEQAMASCAQCLGTGTIANSAANRMARLRDLCAKVPREQVFAATDEMSDSDAAIVRRILDEVQPPPEPVTVQ